MLRSFGEHLDKRRWRERIETARFGAPAHTVTDIKFYEDDRCLIRYRKRGQGKAIVFMCDAPATLELYDPLFDALDDQLTVIAFEVPGNGFSVPKPDYSFKFNLTNDAIARFLGSVAGEGAILAFSCGGAYAAIDIAARYPQYCDRLVVIQAPSWEEEMKWKVRRDPSGVISLPIIGQLLFPRMMVSRAPQWYDLCVGDRNQIDRFCSCTSAAFDHGSRFSLASMFQSYLAGDMVPFGQPEQPTLALWGALDGSHGETDKFSSQKLAKNTTVKILQNVGHFPELENPGQFRQLIMSWSGN